jgi:AcrR family transcriptional regulator
MPPRPKYSKEMILEAAFQLVKEQGIECLNARNIARILRSSIQPIFSYYENMAKLKDELFIMVNRYHVHYFEKMATDEYSIMNGAILYIEFAVEEPNLFRMLYMSNGYQGKKINEIVENATKKSLTDDDAIATGLNSPEKMRLLTDLWLYAHGIASMLVLNQLSAPKNEIEAMIKSMYELLISGR